MVQINTIALNCKWLFIDILGIYFMWICLHYTASILYVYSCTPVSIYGFLLSPFISTALHCQAMRWIIYTGGNNILGMWSVIGAIVMKKLVIG